jgi:hypothetical protein
LAIVATAEVHRPSDKRNVVSAKRLSFAVAFDGLVKRVAVVVLLRDVSECHGKIAQQSAAARIVRPEQAFTDAKQQDGLVKIFARARQLEAVQQASRPSTEKHRLALSGLLRRVWLCEKRFKCFDAVIEQCLQTVRRYPAVASSSSASSASMECIAHISG